MVLEGAAEEEGPDADDGGAFEDSGFEVVGHSHGEVSELWAADFMPAHFLEDFACAGEGSAGVVGVVGEGGHGHESDELDIGHGVDLFGEVLGGADGDA